MRFSGGVVSRQLLWTFATVRLHLTAAFWRMPCDNPLVFERLDPIISPGSVASHVHNVAGGSNFGPSADYASLRQSSCTSCPIKEDLSAYWTPELYYQYQNGSFLSVPNGGMTVYYLQRNGTGDGSITAFPEGFRMISGNPLLRSYNSSSLAQEAVNFVCLGAPGGSTYGSGLPTTDCPDGLRLQVVFPSCWDGVNLDSADHKSHVAFPTGVSTGSCTDPNFPVRLITLFYEVFYDSTDFKDMWYGSGQPFVLANGDPTGYGFHGDFMNGWNVTVLQNAINTCTDPSGDMDICEAFTVQHPASSNLQCHKSPSVDEVVMNTVLPSLPGCNPVTPGPATANYATCPNLVKPTLWTNTTGYYGNIVPPGYNSLSSVSVVQAYKNWNYIGCYADTNSRVLQQRYTPSPMTVELCLDTCQSNGYTFGGLEYAAECWCGNTFNASPLSFQSCSMTCTGNSSEYCGAGLALTTYQLAAAAGSILSSSSISSSAQTTASSSTTMITTTSSSAVATTTGPSIPQSVGVYTYTGCFLDSNTRVLTQRVTAGDGSLETCAASCRQLAFPYVGVEYAGQCYCGSSMTSSTPNPGACSMACTSNANELCGGSWGLQVYHTTAAPPVYNFNWSSVGCYTDSYTRTLRYSTPANATVDSCQAACQSQGYQYAGLESWTECYCDSSIQSTGVVAASTDCNLPCDHNHNQICGGSWRLSIYYGSPVSSASIAVVASTSSAFSSTNLAAGTATPINAAVRVAVATKASSSTSVPSSTSSASSTTSSKLMTACSTTPSTLPKASTSSKTTTSTAFASASTSTTSTSLLKSSSTSSLSSTSMSKTSVLSTSTSASKTSVLSSSTTALKSSSLSSSTSVSTSKSASTSSTSSSRSSTTSLLPTSTHSSSSLSSSAAPSSASGRSQKTQSTTTSAR